VFNCNPIQSTNRLLCGALDNTAAPAVTTTKNSNDKKVVMLTEEEKAQFGTRFPSGYKRVKLLGK